MFKLSTRKLVLYCGVALLTACGGGSGDDVKEPLSSIEIEPQIGALVPETVEGITENNQINAQVSELESELSLESPGTAFTQENGNTNEEQVDEIEDNTLQSESPISALELVQSHPELTDFSEALLSSSLLNYFSDPLQRVTLLATPNGVFQALSDDQKTAILSDTSKVESIVREATIPDARVTEALGDQDNIFDTLNDRVTAESTNGGIQFVHRPGHRDQILNITETLSSEFAVVHIVDDFVNYSATFFPPDSGSVMEELQQGDDESYSNFVFILNDHARLYQALGDNSRQWDVFVPLPGQYQSNFFVDSHIVERTEANGHLLDVGEHVSVDGKRHVIDNDSGSLRIDGIDINLQDVDMKVNGSIYPIGWALGENAFASAFDVVDRPGLYSPVAYHGVAFEFFAELINATDENERFENRDKRYTLLIPDFGISEAQKLEISYRITGDTGDIFSLPSMYSAFGGLGLAMIPDIFPDVDTARAFLHAHTIDGNFTEETLNNSGSLVATVDGTLLEIVNESDDTLLAGQKIDPSRFAHVANGGVAPIHAALINAPDFSGIDLNSPVTVRGALESRNDVNNFIAALDRFNFIDMIQEGDFTVFVPLDSFFSNPEPDNGSNFNVVSRYIVPGARSTSALEKSSGSRITSYSLTDYYDVRGVGDSLTFGGQKITEILSHSGSGAIYIIDGPLDRGHFGPF